MGDKLIRVRLVKSGSGYDEKQKRTLTGLGLRKMNRPRLLKDTPEIRGMIAKVSHLVAVEDAD